MGRIHKLNNELIALIAAGEVVERPASVVKELCENALDAGATSVEVAVVEGGRSRIQVVDNGCGMDPDEVLLALERHATSKISSREDLDRVATLGFRGEALPSIAAVGKMRIETRPEDQSGGTLVCLEAGVVTQKSDIGAARGTRIVIEDLFFNTPARRKFLRAPATETGRVHTAVLDLALANPGVRFRLESNGRTMLDVPSAVGADAEKQRLGALLGRQLYTSLFDFSGAEAGVSVAGFYAAPTHTRRDTRGYHLFLNGRVISDRGLMFSVRRAYRTLLEHGRHPVVVINLGVDRGEVDINVHPAKHEVRFHNDRVVQNALAHVLGAAVAKTPWVGEGRTYLLPRDDNAEVRDREDELHAWHRARVRNALQRFSSQGAKRGGFLGERISVMDGRPSPIVDAPLQDSTVQQGEGELLPGGYFSRLKIVGQIFDTYILCQSEAALVLVDQHAAHERLTFERLRSRRAEADKKSQGLLVPLQLELEPILLAAAQQHQEEIAAIGFDLEPFGGSTLAVRAVPLDLVSVPVEPLVRDLLEELAELGTQDATDDAFDRVCARIACHGSIRAGRALKDAEIGALFRDLEQIDFKAHCPHGRPVARELTLDELRTLFERT